jgi:ApaG protein
MSMQKTFEPQFRVSAKVTYVQSESRPEADYHFFAYKISIKNESTMQAQLLSRHWIITDGNSQTEEVRGAGVAGQQPKISSGQVYEYESACPLPTAFGTMRGSYQMVAEDGTQFDIEIPEFYLIAPSALH